MAEEEFAGWYERTHPRLLAAVTVAVGDVGLAEDVVAEAFARALERWERVKTMASPTGWVFRAALNAARRARRRQLFERRVLARERPANVPPPEADPVLWVAVWSLPPRQRQAVALRYAADLAEAEVARVMGVTPGTVAAALHQARGRLAEQLGNPVTEELA
jgi:RNA polymerase sigma factor (sigma-70 family)